MEARNISKAFGDHVVFDDITLQIHAGETVTVLGRSGAGKSVLLKLMSGLLAPDKGDIFFKGANLVEMDSHELANVRKDLGFLFQSSALFDSMTIGENLELFLKRHTHDDAAAREKKIQRALDLVELDNVIDRMPAELSGGMKKRAGLARSIVLEPELIFYDEPTTGLDPLTAETIANLIVVLQQELNAASVVVTHDLSTAFAVTDRAIMLSNGKKIFDGPIEGISTSTDPFLQQYLKASQVSSERHTEALARYRKSTEKDN